MGEPFGFAQGKLREPQSPFYPFLPRRARKFIASYFLFFVKSLRPAFSGAILVAALARTRKSQLVEIRQNQEFSGITFHFVLQKVVLPRAGP